MSTDAEENAEKDAVAAAGVGAAGVDAAVAAVGGGEPCLRSL